MECKLVIKEVKFPIVYVMQTNGCLLRLKNIKFISYLTLYGKEKTDLIVIYFKSFYLSLNVKFLTKTFKESCKNYTKKKHMKFAIKVHLANVFFLLNKVNAIKRIFL